MMLLLRAPSFIQTPSPGDEIHPLLSLRAEGEAISSIRRGRVNP